MYYMYVCTLGYISHPLYMCTCYYPSTHCELHERESEFRATSRKGCRALRPRLIDEAQGGIVKTSAVGSLLLLFIRRVVMYALEMLNPKP